MNDRRLLVVDDDADLGELLRYIYESHGYLVRLAESGPQALGIARDWAPDVCVVDIELDAMDGYEVARLLAGLHRKPHLIALTGHSDRASRERARGAGFDRFLAKPCGSDELIGALPSPPVAAGR